MINWEGNWLSVPVEWEGCREFLGHNFYNHIKAWMNKSEKVNKENMDISDPAFIMEINSEVALCFWIPSTLNAESLQSFWWTC